MNRDPFITKSQLIEDLKNLGLKEGEVCMLHVSVSSIGWIVGGPNVVLQTILELLSESGTLMMYVGWEDGTYEMSQWPEDKQRAYLLECPPFDPKSSRAYRKWSILTEYLRTWPGACRSENPEASVAAVGQHAKWITSDHPLNYGYGKGSPFEKLCTLKGKILLLGAPLDTITLLHYAESVAVAPKKRIVRYKEPILQGHLTVWIDVEEFDTSRGAWYWDGEKHYFELIMEESLTLSLGMLGKVGDADSYLFDANLLVEFATSWMERTFRNR